MRFQRGDRVRITRAVSEYTGCRGTIVEAASDSPKGVTALGHFVAIDGENGRARPFLIGDLELLRAAKVSGQALEPAARSSAGTPPNPRD
jgi:hypothetical protein